MHGILTACSGVAIGVGLIQLAGVFLSWCLANRIRKEGQYV